MAARIARTLADHGVPTFYSPHSIIGAQQWQDEILKALERCDWFVVLLSPDAIDSMWVKRETAFVLNELRYDKKIVPLNYRPCDLGTLKWLSIYQMVEFQTDFGIGCRELLRTWGIGFKSEK